MKASLIRQMTCPECLGSLRCHRFAQAFDAIDAGVAWCEVCFSWYPIEGGILELLPLKLAYLHDRQRFWEGHRQELEPLGLSEPVFDAIRASDVEAERLQQKHFDRFAKDEHQTYSEYERMPFWKCVDSRTFHAWRNQIVPGAWLLDIGCGQGRSTFNFMDQPIHIVGFDVSKSMIQEAVARYRAKERAAEATFFVGDASRLPFRDCVFEYVLTYGVLHHLPNPAGTAREIARVLKPNGLYFGSENNETALRSLFDALQRCIPLWREEAGREPLISQEKLRQWFSGTPMALESRTHVFVPPHLVNLVGSRFGQALMRLSDRIGGWLPIMRDNGGLITFTGQKLGEGQTGYPLVENRAAGESEGPGGAT